MRIDTHTLNPGDAVGVQHHGSYESRYSIKEVKSVSKTGQVTLTNGDRFTRDGKLMGGSQWHGTYLIPVSEAQSFINFKEKSRAIQVRVQTLQNIVEKVLRDHRNGRGDYSEFSPESKQLLIDAVNNL
jgi:hypothetical protein